MRYHALACDFDGTLAWNGHVSDATFEALERVRTSGRVVILVTGRELDDLMRLVPRMDLFDRVVAENGAVIYHPATDEQRLLGEVPPQGFIQALHERGVGPISVGSVIVSTWHPHEAVVLDTIEQHGVDYHVAFNKGAVMILPAGITKASGLTSALHELRVSPRNTVCIGDAENDQSMFRIAELAVAVNNALAPVKANADVVTQSHHGAGVVECIEHLLEDDCAADTHQHRRHHILVGRDSNDQPVTIPPYQTRMLVLGGPGRGKSTLTTGMVERLTAHGYQVCVLDPEGDYGAIEDIIHVGDSQQAPSIEELCQLLAHPTHSVVANLIGLPYADRPAFLRALCDACGEVQQRTGRPHWLVIDEAHHFFPAYAGDAVPQVLLHAPGLLLVAVRPDYLAPELLQAVNIALSVDAAPAESLQLLAQHVAQELPALPVEFLPANEATLWNIADATPPQRVRVTTCRSRHLRHQRKYAEGDLGWERSFYFRGPEHRTYPRAQNLIVFMSIADEVDDATWLFHAERHDYSRWMHSTIGDHDLARAVAEAERAHDMPLAERKHAVRRAIEHRYTLPA